MCPAAGESSYCGIGEGMAVGAPKGVAVGVGKSVGVETFGSGVTGVTVGKELIPRGRR